jgi:modulator of FtsH protease HflK
MYTDAMQQIYSSVTKVMVDSRQGNNLLYLPLDKLMQLSANQGSEILTVPANGTAAAPIVSPPPVVDTRGRDASRARDAR